MRKESSTNFENEQMLKNYCNAFKTLSLISGRWKLSILFILLENECTYSKFKSFLPKISDRMLSLQLRELQQDLLILNRTDKDKQVYFLSTKGFQLQSVLQCLSDWSEKKL